MTTYLLTCLSYVELQQFYNPIDIELKYLNTSRYNYQFQQELRPFFTVCGRYITLPRCQNLSLMITYHTIIVY